MLSFIFGLIPSVFSTINGITSAIANEKIASLNATTQQEKIAADSRIEALQAQRDVLIQESARSSWPAIMQFLIALGPASYLIKIFLWDKVIGSIEGCGAGIRTMASYCNMFNTDPSDTNLWWVILAVVGFYFVTTTRIFK
jgi:hypothetical protein